MTANVLPDDVRRSREIDVALRPTVATGDRVNAMDASAAFREGERCELPRSHGVERATSLLDHEDLVAIGDDAASYRSAVAAVERRVIARALESAGGDRTAAAKSLGMVERALASKIRELGLER